MTLLPRSIGCKWSQGMKWASFRAFISDFGEIAAMLSFGSTCWGHIQPLCAFAPTFIAVTSINPYPVTVPCQLLTSSLPYATTSMLLMNSSPTRWWQSFKITGSSNWAFPLPTPMKLLVVPFLPLSYCWNKRVALWSNENSPGLS